MSVVVTSTASILLMQSAAHTRNLGGDSFLGPFLLVGYLIAFLYIAWMLLDFSNKSFFLCVLAGLTIGGILCLLLF
jgi:hypothetical protein